MWGQILIAAILVLIIALCIRSLMKDHKSGKSILCGEDCSVCGPDGCPFEAQFRDKYEEYMLEMEKQAKEKLGPAGADINLDIMADSRNGVKDDM